jgi:hypothetical protein
VRVRLYVEGGPKGAHADGLRRFKNGFKQHLARLDPRLSTLDVSPCGSTEETIRDYARAIREDEPNCTVALLVDSDAPVAGPAAQHLQAKLDSAKIPQKARKNIFLMVQCMESWLVTDAGALRLCFGNDLREEALPKNPNIEEVAKKDVLTALVTAVKPTPARHYHKVEHGARILAELNPVLVGQRSRRHAKNLHEFLLSSVVEA